MNRLIAILAAFFLVNCCPEPYETHFRGYATIDDIRMYYEVYGEGEPILKRFGGPAILGPSGGRLRLLGGSEDQWLSVPAFWRVRLCLCYQILNYSTWRVNRAGSPTAALGHKQSFSMLSLDWPLSANSGHGKTRP